jgi:hypothetical protein
MTECVEELWEPRSNLTRGPKTLHRLCGILGPTSRTRKAGAVISTRYDSGTDIALLGQNGGSTMTITRNDLEGG